MRALDVLTTTTRRIVDVAIVALVVVVLAAIAVAKLPELVGSQTFVVAGGSMMPAIVQGDAVVIEPVAATAIAVDDVVSLRVQPAGTLFTHRVIRITERDGQPWFETKGDANAAPDPSLVPADWIVGRVTTTIPLIGYLIALLSIPSGLVFVLGLGTTLLMVAWLLEMVELRAAARREGGQLVVSDWPAMPPSPGRAERLIHALVEARWTGVYRMVPDRRRRATWRRAPAAKPGKAG